MYFIQSQEANFYVNDLYKIYIQFLSKILYSFFHKFFFELKNKSRIQFRSRIQFIKNKNVLEMFSRSQMKYQGLFKVRRM